MDWTQVHPYRYDWKRRENTSRTSIPHHATLLLIIIVCSSGVTCFHNFQPALGSENEQDLEDSRKVLGSSVVTSVSVVMNRGNETETLLTNSIDNPELKTNSIGSPGNLLSPDKYEFYTFDEAGDLVKRLMTWDEIQGLIAGSDTDGVLPDAAVPIYHNENIFPITPETIHLTNNNFHTSDIQDIHKVVENVQHVLRNELVASQTKILPIDKATSFSSEPLNWSLYFPTLWEHMNEDEIEELHHLSNTPTQFETGIHNDSSVIVSPNVPLSSHYQNGSNISVTDDVRKTETHLAHKITTHKSYLMSTLNKYFTTDSLVSTPTQNPLSTRQTVASTTNNVLFAAYNTEPSLLTPTAHLSFNYKTDNYSTQLHSLPSIELYSNMEDNIELMKVYENETVSRFPSYYTSKNNTTKATELHEITAISTSIYQQPFTSNTTVKSNIAHNISSLSTMKSSATPTLYNSIRDRDRTSIKSTQVTTMLPSVHYTIGNHSALFKESTTTRPEPLVTWMFDHTNGKVSGNGDSLEFEKLVTEQYVSGIKLKLPSYTRTNTTFSLPPSDMEAVQKVSTKMNSDRIPNTTDAANFWQLTTSHIPHDTTTDITVTPLASHNEEIFHNTLTSPEHSMQRVPTIDPHPNQFDSPNRITFLHSNLFIKNKPTASLTSHQPYYYTSTEVVKNSTQIAIMVNKSRDTTKLSNKNFEEKHNQNNFQPNASMVATSTHVSIISNKDDTQMTKPMNTTTFALNNCITNSRNGSTALINDDTVANKIEGNAADISIDFNSLYSYNKNRTASESTPIFQKWTSSDKQKENSHIYYYKLPPISSQLSNKNPSVGVTHSFYSTVTSQNSQFDSRPNITSNNTVEFISTTPYSMILTYLNSKINMTPNSYYIKQSTTSKIEVQKLSTSEHSQKGDKYSTNEVTNNSTDDLDVLHEHNINVMENGISAISNHLLPVQGRISSNQLDQNFDLKSNVDFSNNDLHAGENNRVVMEAYNKSIGMNEKSRPLYSLPGSLERLSMPYKINSTTVKEFANSTLIDMNDQYAHSSVPTSISTPTTVEVTAIDPSITMQEESISLSQHRPIATIDWSTNQENITIPFTLIYSTLAGSTIRSEYKKPITTLFDKPLQKTEYMNEAGQETQPVSDPSGSITTITTTINKPTFTSRNNNTFHMKHKDANITSETQIINKTRPNLNDTVRDHTKLAYTFVTSTATAIHVSSGRLPSTNFSFTSSATTASISFNNSKLTTRNNSTNLHYDIQYVEIKLENKTHGISNETIRQKEDGLKISTINSQKQAYPNINPTATPQTPSVFRSPISQHTRSPALTLNQALELHPAPYENMGLEASTAYLGDDIKTFIDLCNEFSFKIWITQTGKSLATSRSIVLSPFATLSTLAMIFLGARGSTSGSMNDFLRLDDMVTFNPHQILHNITESALNSKNNGVANIAFVREIFSDKTKGKVLEFYRERLQQYYDSYIEEINFDIVGDLVRRRTNLSVKKQTQGRIQDFLKGSTLMMRPPLAVFTANIFQTDCNTASTDGRDGEMYFVVRPSSRQRRLIPIPAVVYRGGFQAGYEPSLDATAITLSPESIISTILVLPGQQGQVAPGDGLARLEQRLLESSYRRGAWSRLLRSLLFRHGLEVQVPRFSHKSILNMTLGIQKIGMSEIFSPNKADLSGINGLMNELYLSDMIQTNMFSLCGTDTVDARHHVEIFPSSSLRIGRTPNEDEHFHFKNGEPSKMRPTIPAILAPRQARLSDNPRLRFDRPFLYVVRHNPTGMILHIGRFNPRLVP